MNVSSTAFEVMQYLLHSRNQTAISTTEGFLHPAVKIDFSVGEGLNVREGLYCYGLPFWGCLVVGCFRTEYGFGTISTTEIIFLVSTNPRIPYSLEICTLFFLNRRYERLLEGIPMMALWEVRAWESRLHKVPEGVFSESLG